MYNMNCVLLSHLSDCYSIKSISCNQLCDNYLLVLREHFNFHMLSSLWLFLKKKKRFLMHCSCFHSSSNICKSNNLQRLLKLRTFRMTEKEFNNIFSTLVLEKKKESLFPEQKSNYFTGELWLHCSWSINNTMC